MDKKHPETLAQQVIESCESCAYCRYDDISCVMFPELFRLSDREREAGSKASSQELRAMIDLCNFCGICPCQHVRTDIRDAKDAFIERDGLKPALRILEDVQRIGKVCGAYPKLANLLLQKQPSASLLKRIVDIHPRRKMPEFPEENFMTWAAKRGIDRKRGGNGRKVAYFAGCTAQFLFPNVAKATVEVLQHNGIEVYCPEQKCCGMPTMLEGDRRLTFELATCNLEQLTEAVESGYEIVCSCPTCGYMPKNVFSEGLYSSPYWGCVAEPEVSASDPQSRPLNSRQKKLAALSKFAEDGGLQDEGYFGEIDVRKRIAIASRTYDLGEYLRELQRAGVFNTKFGPAPHGMAYYPPCHLREQRVGEPWYDLLSLLPEGSLQKVGDSSQCCGIAGIMGFKREFYEASIAMGSRLMEDVKAIRPERLLTDCLSCRLQFNQLLPYKVDHPVEILEQSYKAYQGR